MDLISIALGLASIAPSIVKWIAGDKAGEVAQKVVDIAAGVTGIADPKSATDAILKDPALALQFQQSWMAHENAMYQEETKRLESVNQTIRAEATSEDKYVRRWRPTWGYVTCLVWAAQGLGYAYIMAFEPQWAAEVGTGLAAQTGAWTAALAVLGVAVWKRSADKQAAAGAPDTGLISAIAERIRGR